MTYIVPSSDIGICSGVPISNDYKNTLYFAHSEAQGNYFISKRVFVFTDYSYQRVNKNTIRISTPAESLYNCNYMYFRNENFGTKNFYAFITNVEYINNQCSEITYEIDEIQTWWFNLSLHPCLVVRQHTTNDTIYSQCEPEDIKVKPEYAGWSTTGNPSSLTYILMTAGTWVSTAPDLGIGHIEPPSQATVISNVNCPIEVSMHTESGTGDASIGHMLAKIRDLVENGREDAILAIYCVPTELFGSTVSSRVTERADIYTGQKSTMRGTSFQGYVPKNNKLYNYPFCMLEVQAPSVKQEFALEDFRPGTGAEQEDRISFSLYSVQAPVPQAYLIPKHYQGQDSCWEKGIVLDNFLQVPFMGDAFAMFCAQNLGSMATGLVASLFQVGITAFSPDAVGKAIGIRGLVETIGRGIGEVADATQRPNNVYGMGGGVGLTNFNQNKFRLEYKTISYWEAHQIDSYFTQYGYKQGIIMMPNVHARQRFTYVQTDGCCLTGSLPSDSASFIKSCFDKGITFWADHDHVGNYSLDNPTL